MGFSAGFFAGAAFAAGAFFGAAFAADFLASLVFAVTGTLLSRSLGPLGMTKKLSLESEHSLIYLESVMVKAKDHIREYALAEVEKKLQVQKDILFASDERAQRYVNIGVALFVVFATAFATTKQFEVKGSTLGILLGSLCAVLGVLLCGWVARPNQSSFLPGYEPRRLLDDAEKQLPLAALQASFIRWGQFYIDENAKTISRSNVVALIGSWLIIASPLVTGTYIFFANWRWC